MSMQRYYPPVSDLIPVEAIPSELQQLKNVLQEGVEYLLKRICYKDLVVSGTGDTRYYSLTILTKRLELPLLGGLNLVFFRGSETNLSEFPVILEWSWPLYKYFPRFKIKNFSSAPEAFLDILIELSEINDREEFFDQIVSTFLDDGNDAYLAFLDNISNTVYGYNNGNNDVETQITTITDNIEIIKNELHIQLTTTNLFTFKHVYDNYQDNTILNNAVEAIKQSAEILDREHNVQINIYKDILFCLLLDFSNVDEKFDRLLQFFKNWLADIGLDDIKSFLIPQASFQLNNINMALEFPRNWLVPVYTGDEPVPGLNINDPLPEPYRSGLEFNVGSLIYSTQGGFLFDNQSAFTFKRSMIGNTGILVELINLKVDMSKTHNIPEADADGRSADFQGVYAEKAAVYLPEKWFSDDNGSTLELAGYNILIGTGGISGTIALEAINPNNAIGENDYLWKKLGNNGFKIGFNKFDLTLSHGEFVSTNIKGALVIPGFKDALDNDAQIEISMSLAKDGNFYITASERDGFRPIGIPGVLEYTMKSLTVGRGKKGGEDKFYISTSGSIKFTGEGLVSQLFEDPLEIDQLTIWQDGTIELKGLDGVFKLKKPKTLKLGPADITITAIHFGTDERMHNNIMRKYWYFGFDGGISINPGGIDARGDGVKIYFTVDNSNTRPLHMFFRIQSLSIDLIIPGSASRDNAAVIINGYLSMKEPSKKDNTDASPATEYVGGVSIALPKLQLSASAGMRYNPSLPSYLIDVSLDLPMAIPLGPTGVGIYGFRGLLGQRYVVSREAAGLTDKASWYEYYKAKPQEGIHVSKMSNQDGFSVGAGVSMATAFDGGKVFSSKVFAMLSPGFLYIEGKGAILRKRIGLDPGGDPPFFAVIAIDNDKEKSIEAIFGANIKIPEDSGSIAKVNGLAEMKFYFSGAGSWYVNIGRDQPEDKRVRAEIFNLFNAYFYFMLSKEGIKAGAGAKWEFNKKIGPLRISAGAFLDTTGKVSFKPVQIGGSIALGGRAGISVACFKLVLEVKAWLGAECPKPFIINGGLSFRIKLPWPFKRLGGPYKIEFTWSINRDRDLSEISLMDPDNNVKAINRLTGEAFRVYYEETDVDNAPGDIDSYIIPLDSFIDVEFLKGMCLKDATGTKFGAIGQGAYYTEDVPPRKGKSAQVKHEFRLEDIKIQYWNDNINDWIDYDMYKAIRPNPSNPASIIAFPDNTDDLAYGFWQCDTPHKYNKLRIFAKSPLSYITDFTSGPPSPPEDFGYKEGFLFCEGQQRRKTCVIFPVMGKTFASGVPREHQRVLIRITGDNDGIVRTFANPFNLKNGLTFGNGKAELFFAKPQALVNLRLSSYAGMVKVKFFRRAQREETGFSDLPLCEYVEITEKTFIPAAQEHFGKIAYKHTNHDDCEIDKITIESTGGIVGNDGFLLNESPGFLLQQNRGKLLLEDAVTSLGQTQLFSICMLNVVDYNFNEHTKDQNEVDEDNKAMRDSFMTVIDPIWRPDMVYRIVIKTNDYLSSEKNPPDHNKTYHFFFKTAGPVGHFHEHNSDYQDLKREDREDQYRLATLKPYIDYSRSYPNADGRLINAKPLFYDDPKLLVFYKQNTVHAMFNNFDEYGSSGAITSELQVLIKDPAELLSSDPDDPTQAYVGENKWKQNPDPILTLEVRMINNLSKDGANCSGYEVMTPLAVAQEISAGGLRPDTLYTAVFNAVYKTDIAQVHSYVFKTSQYANFEDQVQSYILRDDESEDNPPEAIFNIEKEFDATTISNASALLNGTFDLLISKYANEFERLTDGVLQLGFLPPAVTTDFNIIKNSSTGDTIGIIVRSPEPFNDPKIPVEDLSDTIELSAIDSNPVSNCKVIFSPDKTQAFISNSALNIPAGMATVTFRYKQYSIHEFIEENEIKKIVGYETVETVMVEIGV